jgi:hypothetical protein
MVALARSGSVATKVARLRSDLAHRIACASRQLVANAVGRGVIESGRPLDDGDVRD